MFWFFDPVCVCIETAGAHVLFCPIKCVYVHVANLANKAYPSQPPSAYMPFTYIQQVHQVVDWEML